MIARALLLAAVIALAAPGTAMAQGTLLTVNTIDDTFPDGCTTAPDGCTLREAVGDATAEDTIFLPQGHYVLARGELLFDGDTSLQGEDPRTTIIDADGESRVGYIDGSTLLAGVTVTGGAGRATRTRAMAGRSASRPPPS